MLKAIGYILIATAVAVWLSGCATGASVGASPGHASNGVWQEQNQAVQDACDEAVAKIATEAGVTAQNINEPDVQRAIKQLRWRCNQQNGATL